MNALECELIQIDDTIEFYNITLNALKRRREEVQANIILKPLGYEINVPYSLTERFKEAFPKQANETMGRILRMPYPYLKEPMVFVVTAAVGDTTFSFCKKELQEFLCSTLKT